MSDGGVRRWLPYNRVVLGVPSKRHTRERGEAGD